MQHNRTVLEPGPAWDTAIQLYTYVKNLADVVIPQEYGMTKEEKLTIAQVLEDAFNTRGGRLRIGGLATILKSILIS